MKTRSIVLTLLFLTVACRAPIKDSPVDEMVNWGRAANTFAAAVEAVTAAGRAGQISKAAGRRILPIAEEGNTLIQDAYAAIADTPMDQDPTFDADVTARLLRLGVRITAILMVEKQEHAEHKESE